MLLLIRRISPYTGADVLLGVFTAAAQAEAARAEYLERYAAGRRSDPWRRQAYRDEGLSAQDLVLQAIEGPATDGAEVFVVSEYSEGFGQIVRRFDSVHASADAAAARIAEIEAAEDAQYALCQRARVGVTLSDAREDQPRLAWNR